MGPNDGLMILSVGGGSRDRNVSVGVVVAAEFAREVGATVYAIVGRSNGDAVALAQHSLLIPVSGERLTPHAESFQSVIWHLLVSHPLLSVGSPLWESLEPGQASRLR